jgi:molybdopterin molybdotransferase
LEVIEDIKAGDIPKKVLKDNQAARIMTGAIIPRGADSVIMVEDTQKTLGEGKKELVRIFKKVKPGENIRRRGEDIRKGELIISKGTRLKASHLGILASLGMPRIKVTRRPKIAILATGDEVIKVEDELKPGKLRNSNSYILSSQVLNCGGIPKNLGVARDRPGQLKRKIREGFDCDLILTSGGVSVGEYDLVKDVLARMGTDIQFWKVAMRPGKPLVFGKIKGIPVFGLPGNPVSSLVSFEVFVRPMTLKMLGQKDDHQNEIEAVLEQEIEKKRGFRYFLRAWTRWEKGAYRTMTSGPQGSAILKSMALANSLIILPEDEEFISRGRKVLVRFLD